MTTLHIERAYQALCETMGDVKGWEQIEPARKLIPQPIVKLEREQVEAEAALDLAVTVHEQAYTDASRDNVAAARDKLQAIVDQIEKLKWVWRNHQEWLED